METKSNIYKKLAEVKTKIGKLTKDTANPFFKSKYADINQLIEMTDPVLLEHGLLTLQPIEEGHIVTKIVDIDTGETITSSLKLPEIVDPQKVGSAITYFRRYSLKSLLNIQEEDDDANKASNKTPNNTQNHTANPPAKTPAPKQDLYPGIKDKWNSAVAYVKDFDGLVFDALDTIKKKYNLSADNEAQLLEEAKGIKSEPVEIPQETIDAMNAASSSEELTNLWKDCEGLWTSKEFIELWNNRRKELLIPAKGKKAA